MEEEMEYEMEEVDWDNVKAILEDLIETVKETTTEFCQERYFKACLALNDKVLPVLRELLVEVKAEIAIVEIADRPHEVDFMDEE